MIHSMTGFGKTICELQGKKLNIEVKSLNSKQLDIYTNNHIDYVAASLARVYNRRNEYRKGLKIVWEAAIMRHFTVELEPVQ